MVYGRVFLGLIIIAVAFPLAVCADAQDTEDQVSVLEDSISTLRRAGEYERAAAKARQLLDLLRADTTTNSWKVVDTEWQLRTIEQAANFSLQERFEFRVADSLSAVFVELWESSRLAEAKAALKQDLSIRRKLLSEPHPEIALTLNDLAAVHYAQGDYAGAEGLFRQALAMRREVLGHLHPEVAGTVNNLAFLLQLQGAYAEAEPMFKDALSLYRQMLGSEDPLVATALGNLGSLLADRGDYDGARDLQREALAMRRKLLGDEHPEVAMSLNNLALVMHAQGEFAAAEPLYRRALSITQAHFDGPHPYVASALNNLAGVLEKQGDKVNAELLYREALEMRRELFGNEHPDVAASLNNIAAVMVAQGNWTGGEALYRESLAMLRRLLGQDHPNVALCLNNLAGTRLRQGDYVQAESLYREATGISRRLLGERHRDVALGVHNLALVHWDKRAYGTAESLFVVAIETWRDVLGEQHPLVAEGLWNQGRMLLAQADCARAERLLAEGARVYDAARLRVGAGLKKATFLHTPYPDLAIARAECGLADEAWSAAERASSRLLADLMLASENRALSPEEQAHEDYLREQLSDLEDQLSAFRDAAGDDGTEESSWRVESTHSSLLAAEAAWGSFQQRMAKKYPVSEGQAYPLERVQRALTKRAAIVGWLDVEHRGGPRVSWGYVVRDSGSVQWVRLARSFPDDEQPSSFSRIRSTRDVAALRSFLGFGAVEETKDLWTERLRPLIGALDQVRDLIIVPSGAMLGFPIEILIDDEGVFVGDRYTVSYVPSATIHTWLAEKGAHSGTAGPSLLVGDPPFSEEQLTTMEQGRVVVASAMPPDASVLRSALAGNDQALASLPRLPGTREEISSIAAVLAQSTVLVGADASEQEIVRLAESGELAHFETIHLATHALVDDQRPEKSALVLSQVDLPDPLEAAVAGTRIYDGLVTTREIVREWDLHADLVTLSGCETGLGREVLGEGYIGFAHAFLQSGARSLLVSLWPVEDEATSLLMRRFYENRTGKYADDRGAGAGHPMSKAKALQEAKHWLRTYEDEYGRRLFEHPYFWSAFILIGDRG
ncbi:MAG: CHAT domain-containing protein [Candidatus Eisenbacteria sp.]|nr:CHAT domain-containing protein [Candidatus Eisenbacteria bacterium]